jgi:hypothetical protein
VPVQGERGVDEQRRRHGRRRHPEREQSRLCGHVADEVLEEVGARGGEAVELQGGVMDLVHGPEHVRAVDADVDGERDEVVDDDGEAESQRHGQGADGSRDRW